MLKCLEKCKVSGYTFLLVLVLLGSWSACKPFAGTGKPLVTAETVPSARGEEECKARIMACNFVKKHLGVTVGPETIYHFKITGKEIYTMDGCIRKNGSVRNWSVTLLFNGSDWNNINNWAELNFCTNYPDKDG